MTRIDFYLLNRAAEPKERFACKLVHKAYRLGHRIAVLAGSAEQAHQLDQLLWTFEPGSFIPHGIGDADEGELPVVVGHAAPPPDYHDLLVSLCPDVPACFSRFSRVAEVVGPDDDERRAARERFRFYRDRGYTLDTHDL